MHETGYAKDIVDTVVKAGEDARANEVKTVYLTIGEMCDIIEELFCELFAYLVCGTIASNAGLVIDHVPLSMRCTHCGEVYRADLYSRRRPECPACSSKDSNHTVLQNK